MIAGFVIDAASSSFDSAFPSKSSRLDVEKAHVSKVERFSSPVPAYLAVAFNSGKLVHGYENSIGNKSHALSPRPLPLRTFRPLNTWGATNLPHLSFLFPAPHRGSHLFRHERRASLCNS